MANFEENLTDLYENFDEILVDSDCEMRVSEYQGLLSGLITGGLTQFGSSQSSMLSELVHDGNRMDASLQRKVDELFQNTQQAFADQDQLTPILIPDDGYPLIDRLEAIGLWCQGFLLGFGLQAGQLNRLAPEINEALQDISQIANIDIQSDNSESSQMALETLVEHIKVAVKMIYLEQVLKPTKKPSGDNKPTIH